jgi:ABC-2 type transport system permease protein
VINQLRSELFKFRTTRTSRILLVSLAGLSALIVCLHVFTLNSANLSQVANQPHVFGWGSTIGALFGALFGAIAITAEFRYGTIRPTLLANPNRARTMLAKAGAAAVAAVAVGLLAAALVTAIGAIGFAVRGISIKLTAGDFIQLFLGGALAAALWAVVGIGIGTLVRGQIGAVAGLTVWLVLIENILAGNLPSEAKYAPGASGGALAGMIPAADSVKLLAPAVGALLLIGYAVAASVAGLLAVERRDIG